MGIEIARLDAVLSAAETRDFDRSLDKAQGRFSKFGSVIKTGALAAGAAIGTGLAITAKVGFDEFVEGQKVAAQTNAVLKSTGGVANVTAGQIDTLAESLMRKTGIDDETIKSGANLLLTFKDIRNEAGAGNDIFSQATTMLQDMSVALGQDTKQSAIQLGKALNDPIKGVTALRRVGIQMTSAQEDQIKTLVESGDVMGAQKIILKELESQFGGSAEAAGKTFAGQMNILKQTFSNTAGEIVGRFIPVLLKIAQFVAPLLLGGLDLLAKGADKLSGFFQQFADVVRSAFSGVSLAVTGTGATYGEFGGKAFKISRSIVAGFQRILSFVRDDLVPWFRKHVLPLFVILAGIVRDAFRRMVAVIRQNRPQLLEIWGAIRAAAELLGKVLKHVVLPIIRFVFTEVLPRVIGTAIKTIAGIITAVRKIKEFFVNTLQPAVLSTFNFFRDRVQVVVDRVRAIVDAIRNVVNEIKALPGKVLGPLNRVSDFFGGVKNAVTSIGGDIHALDLMPPAAAISGVSANLFPAVGLARAMGLTAGSTYRPGATVAGSGGRSDHSYFPSKAVDFFGAASAMNRFAKAVAGLPGIDTVIYSPVGLWKAGAGWGSILSDITRRDHYSHVHVDTFDRGGWLKPGWTLAGNFTGRPEPVGAMGGDIHLRIDLGEGETLYKVFRKQERRHDRRHGG